MAAVPYGSPDRFPTTHWSLVVRVGVADDQSRREALGELLACYLQAMRAHLIYRKGLAPERADDLVQEFVTAKILEKNLIAQADRDVGKFRTFLLTALDRFVINRLRDERAAKRSPRDGPPMALDEQADVLQQQGTPSDIFDMAWAREVIAEALRRMRCECEASGRTDLWGVFECRVVGPILEGTAPLDYRELIARFGFQSPSQATNALATAKRMYARMLRSVIGQYARSEPDIDAEIDELHDILARGGS